MDERVKSEYRKIYAELLSIIIYFTAGMLLIKYIFFDAGFFDCITEFLILIGSALYRVIRQWMLGLDPNEGVPKGKRVKRVVWAVVGWALVFGGILYMKRGGLDPETFAAGGEFFIVYIILCIAVAYGTEKICAYFADRRKRKYED